MALPSTVHRFRIELSDVDRGVYDSLDFQIARHPSETLAYALTRVLAYCLELRFQLVFGRGLGAADEPALAAPDTFGGVALWIDVGGPSAARLHKASKLAGEVCVYTYKDVDRLRAAEWAGKTIHNAEAIRVVGVPATLLEPLEPTVGRNNDWGVLRTGGRVYVTVGGATHEGAIEQRSVVEG